MSDESQGLSIFEQWASKISEYGGDGTSSGSTFTPISGGMTLQLAFSYKFGDGNWRMTTDAEDAVSALEALAEADGLTEKVKGYQMRPTFLLTRLANDVVTGWKPDEDFTYRIVAYPQKDESTGIWGPHFMYKLFWACLTDKDRDSAIPGYVKSLENTDLLGSGKFWGVIGQVVDPSYDKDDESTWPYTTRTYTKVNEETGEEEEVITPKRYVYLQQAFSTKSELLEWLNSQGFEVEADSEESSEVKVPIMPAYKAAVKNDDLWGEGDWEPSVRDIFNAVPVGVDLANDEERAAFVEQVALQWAGTPFTKEMIEYVLSYSVSPAF